MTDGARPFGDMDPESFRREAHRVADWIADYFAHPERYPVLSQVRPGDIARALPAEAPEQGDSFDAIFADFERVIVPGITHWNHPGFFAYFAITGSAPGNPMHTGHVCVFGGAPNVVSHAQNILLRASNCTWTSRPMMVS